MVDKGERIFLLEVFVDNVHLENCKVDNKPVKTCVRFKFLNYPFLEIMEDEYCKVPDETCNIKFQSGKSCLFSLRKNPQGSKKPPLNLHVSVVRMESESAVTEVGKTLINLSGSFTNLIQTANQRPDNGNPVSKIIKETYVLSNDKSQTVGDITIFVRLSCFGKIIVTQFQMSGLESKSFLFKAVSDIRGKQFEGSGDAGGVFDSSLPGAKSGGLGDESSKISGGPGQGQMGMMGGPPGMAGSSYPGMMGPGMGPGMMGPGMMGPGMMEPGMAPGMMGPGMMGPGMMGPGMMGPGMMGPGMMGPGMGPGMGMVPPGMAGIMGATGTTAVKPFGDIGPSSQQGGLDYQNFTATVNGHVLNIKVLRKPKKLKQPEAILCKKIDESSSSDSEDEGKVKGYSSYGPCSPCPPTSCNPQCPKSSCQPDRPVPRIPLCDCDVPIPPCLVCPPPPASPPKKKKKDKKKRNNSSKCPVDYGMYCRADCPLGFPKPPGIVPPNYAVPSMAGASPTATGEPQNFLISMEPRREYPPMAQPPLPSCITVRDTQYEEGDVGGGAAGGGKKKSTGKKKGKK